MPPPHAAHAEEGEGNWLVSYADMMTLLVGFFVILLSFSKVDNAEMEKVRQEVTKEFGGTYTVPYGDMRDRIREALNKLGLGDQFAVKTTDSGVDISFLGTVFFSQGSADLKSEAGVMLQQLLPLIKSEAGGFNVVIEGHTDDAPVVGGQFLRNNWELSSLRACRVLDALAAEGFPIANLTAVGYGEARPIVPNRDADGNPIPTNMSQNRRVIIKLIKRAESTMGVKPEGTDVPEASEKSLEQ